MSCSEAQIWQHTPREFSVCLEVKKKRVSIRFTNDMIDTVVDRFGSGTDGNQVFYRPDGKTHFVLSADIEISNQFFSWVCGFRKKATIISPPEVIEDFMKFLDDIVTRY